MDPIVFFFLLAIAFVILNAIGRAAAQHSRDDAAREIVNNPHKYNFILYLRPFASTNQVSQTHTYSHAGPVHHQVHHHQPQSERLELERQLEKASRPIAPLIAFGLRGEHVGAGRARISETEWRNKIQELMAAALLIIMLPSTRPGTKWELERLFGSSLVRKTVFVNATGNWKLFSKRKFDQKNQWAELRSLFARYGYELPFYESGGQLFFYGAARKPVIREKLKLNEVGRLRRFLNRVVRLR